MPAARAPGKVMLAGEYAVLDGGEAVLIAVDRYAVARVGTTPAELPPLLAAVRDQIRAARGAESAALRAAAAIAVDTGALQAADGRKLGLGSSAAAVAAATYCALAAGGEVELTEVHRIAHAAHRTAQARSGHPGSGADVAASVWGGVVAVRSSADPAAPPALRFLELPEHLHLVVVWTGVAAATPPLVAAVMQLRERAPDRWAAWRDAIDLAAQGLIRACADGDAGAAVAALATGANAVAALGHAAGVPLETEAHRRLAALAGARGGACKPTGAGAGDLAVAGFTDAGAAEEFRSDVAAAGMTALDLRVAPGAQLTP
jgi:phosphomevalonate kinase